MIASKQERLEEARKDIETMAYIMSRRYSDDAYRVYAKTIKEFRDKEKEIEALKDE